MLAFQLAIKKKTSIYGGRTCTKMAGQIVEALYLHKTTAQKPELRLGNQSSLSK
jgi:hypothetical protein